MNIYTARVRYEYGTGWFAVGKYSYSIEFPGHTLELGDDITSYAAAEQVATLMNMAYAAGAADTNAAKRQKD